VRGLRVGVLAAFLGAPTEPDVAARVREGVRALESLGLAVEEVTLPRRAEIIPAWWTICLSEASAYHQESLARRPEDFGPAVRERLQAGFAIPAVQYLQAQRVRRAATEETAALFGRVDLLVLPTVLAEAPPLDAVEAAGASEAVRERMAPLAPFNLTGMPAVSVPCGFTASGLPVGLQLVGPRFADRRLLAVAHAVQQALGWPGRPRPLDAALA
jgi:aspartyl-tRNA(Asn)/glutamyl-tRNA(Gln) amidotransferase subunit A